jgi:hypothetical protein
VPVEGRRSKVRLLHFLLLVEPSSHGYRTMSRSGPPIPCVILLGGSGLEEFLRRNFPRDLVVILDFWHAADHLTELAGLLHPTDEAKRQELVTSWCHTMKHESGQRIVEVLQAHPLPRQKAVRDKHAAVVNYLAHNIHRMDYPHYVAQGWRIGSGAVESACKTIVGQRLKQAGMRWRQYGTNAMCHLRALFKSEPSQWQAFWQRRINEKRTA